ncbi:J domain-containing protein [Lysobacter sp.]|uniref:J domain-containing protein n=1 Tax=Lysobacter sp. TaxID=72226 RepID=UPI002D24D7EF|nr:J domain-containing protein [Lysobacter sp.]HZX75782.1 J domain-containing protein [Lysobacter sp.]
MNFNEWAVVIGGGALGYWLVAVMWPHLRGGRTMSAPLPALVQARLWHDELGVSRDADRDTIEAAYRARLDEHRPERIAQLPAELQEQAHARRMKLELAYDAALRDLEWLRPRTD